MTKRRKCSPEEKYDSQGKVDPYEPSVQNKNKRITYAYNPDTTYAFYKDGELICMYVTDKHIARVIGVKRALLIDGKRYPRDTSPQRLVGRMYPGCHGSHYVAVSLGGVADAINVVPMYALVNTKVYRDVERRITKHIKQVLPGTQVLMNVDVYYSDDTTLLPSSITVTVWDEVTDCNGRVTCQKFLKESIQNVDC